jgi:hypothetical protein
MPQSASLAHDEASNNTLRIWAHLAQLLASRGLPVPQGAGCPVRGAKKYFSDCLSQEAPFNEIDEATHTVCI